MEKAPQSKIVQELQTFIAKHPPPFNVLSDTSSLVYLAKTGLLETLVAYYNLFIPSIVLTELSIERDDQFPETKKIKKLVDESRLQIVPVGTNYNSLQFSEAQLKRLHKGERSVLLIYPTLIPCFILIDDLKLIRICREHTIPFTSAVIIPIMLLAYQKISYLEAAFYVREITRVGFFSEKMITIVQNLLHMFADKA